MVIHHTQWLGLLNPEKKPDGSLGFVHTGDKIDFDSVDFIEVDFGQCIWKGRVQTAHGCVNVKPNVHG